MEKWVGAIIAVVFIVILGFFVYNLFRGKLIPYISDKVEDGVSDLMSYMNPSKGGGATGKLIVPKGIYEGFSETISALR